MSPVAAGKPRRFVVSSTATGLRLDVFVARACGVTRAEAQRWTSAGGVSSGGRPRRSSDTVRAGDAIDVRGLSPPRTDVCPEDGIAFDVIYVDDDVVVLVKPAGLVVHPARGHERGTLVHGLLARGLFTASDGGALTESDEAGHVRPGIVHRLDRGTSGVLVVARTARAREDLKAQFAAHTVERAYEAI